MVINIGNEFVCFVYVVDEFMGVEVFVKGFGEFFGGIVKGIVEMRIDGEEIRDESVD